MNKVALYGSACNPPHLVHHAILKNLKKYFNDIWFMPCYQHQFGKNMLDVEHRLNMAKLVASIEEINLCTYEIESNKKNTTWETLQKLQTLHPNVEFVIVIGGDNISNFQKWDHWQELAENYSFIGYKRNLPSYPVDLFKNITILEYELTECSQISSSLVREFFYSNQELIKTYLHPEIFSYIATHKLYQNES